MSAAATRSPTAQALELCLQRARTHENVRHLLKHLTGSQELDDEVYRQFRARFPKANVRRISGIRNDRAWQSFFDLFRDRVADIQLVTLLTTDINGGLSKRNVHLVCRGVWLAVEVARKKEQA
jgi:polysaccharide biosynthesis protein